MQEMVGLPTVVIQSQEIRRKFKGDWFSIANRACIIPHLTQYLVSNYPFCTPLLFFHCLGQICPS